MASDKNILKPGSGDPVVIGKLLDILLGCFWMTKVMEKETGEGMIFSSMEEAITAYDFGHVTLRAKIKVMPKDGVKYQAFKDKLLETTIGKLLFNEILPEDYPYVEKEVDKKVLSAIVDDMMHIYGVDKLPVILDRIKTFGFKYVTYSGVTWGIDDIKEPEGKKKIVDEGKVSSEKVQGEYNEGLLSEEERIRKNIEIWHNVKSQVEKLIPGTLDRKGSVYDMWKSGARGSISQITNMAGMKGLIQNTAGDTLEFPILSSGKEGLTPIEYFITTHGSRKGLTDTALNTARAGYLTRRLFDVAQDVLITEEDCGTKDGIVIIKETASGIETPISKNIKGRVLAKDVANKDGEVIFKRNAILSKRDAEQIEGAGVTEVYVRSPLTCKTIDGICGLCYGLDLGKNKLVDIGEAVGTVASQAIGEPGTQLTMRTFHAGGTASVGGDITQGLPRVEEVFEKRNPKNAAVLSHNDGVISEIKNLGKEKIITILPDIEDKVAKSTKKKNELEYSVHYLRQVLVKVGDKVHKGQFLTDGSASIDEIFKYSGKEKTQEYIIAEIKKLYELQGEAVSRKHIEVIVRQMFSRMKIKEPGDTGLIEGNVIEHRVLQLKNKEMKAAGKEEAKAEHVVMGITEVSLSRESFLSAASFQHTTRVLISSAVRGAEDTLKGLKENVIVGRLIPAGTGFPGSPKAEMIRNLQESQNVYKEE